jgi:hypothetical protein
MALIFADGFDSYSATADLLTRYDAVGSSTYVNFSPTGGRFGGGALVINNDDYFCDKIIPLTGGDPGVNDLFVTFSVMMEDLTQEGSAGFIVFSQDGFIGFGTALFLNGVILLVSGGVLKVYRGSSFIATGSYPITTDTWYRIEVRLSIHNSAGQVEIKVNGSSDIYFSGDTYDSGLAGINVVKFGAQSEDGNTYFDDVVIYSLEGDAPNSFLGDLRIATIRPDGDGDSSDSTPLSGDRYTNVDDTAMHDGDSSYVAMGLDDEDLYTVGALPYTPAAVYAVVTNVACRADGTTPRTIRGKVKSGTTEGNGEDRPVAYGSSYKTVQNCFALNPDTTAAWTASDIDTLQIGQEVTL